MFKTLKTVSLVLLYLFAISILQSCIKEPELISIDKIDFTEKKGDDININVLSSFYNPNKMDIKTSSVKYSFYIKEIKLGEGTINDEIILKGKDETQISSINTIDLKKMGEYFAQEGFVDTIDLKIIIEAKFTSLKLPIKRQFNKQIITKDIIKHFLSEETIKESIAITNLRPVKISTKNSEFKFSVIFNNEFPIDFKLKEINLSAFNNEHKQDSLGNTILLKEVLIKQKAKTKIPLSIKLNNKNMLQTAFTGIFSGKRSIFMSGFITVDIEDNTFKLPINQSFNFN